MRMLDVEMTAQTMATRLHTRAAMIPAIEPRHMRNYVDDLADSTKQIVLLMNYDLESLAKHGGGQINDKVKLVFQSMVQAGMVSAARVKQGDLDVTPAEKSAWLKGFKKIDENTQLGKLS